MTALLLALLIAAPGGAALTLSESSAAAPRHTLLALTGVWCAAATGWLIAVIAGAIPQTLLIEIVRLVELEAEMAGIALSFQLTPQRVGLLFCGLFLLLPETLAQFEQTSPQRSAAAGVENPPQTTIAESVAALRLLLGVVASGAIAVLCDDLAVMTAVWLLLDELLFRAAPRNAGLSDGDGTANERGAALTHRQHAALVSVVRLSSFALLAAVLLAATRYHSTSLTAIVEAAASDVRVDAAIVRSGILVWFALAASGRAGLFPLTIWLRPLTESPFVGASHRLAVVAWGAVLPAVALWTGLTPLLPLSPDSGLLLATLGGLSSVLLGAIAVTTPAGAGTQRSVWLLLLAGIAGLVSASVISLVAEVEQVDAAATLTLLLFVSSVAVAVLALPRSPRLLQCAAGALLLSGLAGPNLLLDRLQTLRQLVSGNAASLPDAAPAASISPELVTALWWSVCLGQFLLGAIVVLTLRPRASAASEAASNRRGATTVFVAARPRLAEWCVPGVAVVIGLGLAGLNGMSDAVATSVSFAEFWQRVGTTCRSLWSFNAATPAGLLGGVLTWLLLRASESAQAQVRQTLSAGERLARNWFYAAELARLASRPFVWTATVVEFVDRQILGRRRGDAWQQQSQMAGHMIEEIADHGPAYPSLAALLAVAGLLLALIGFGR